MPENGGILFVGSSSIRLWDTPASFPGETIINRGFGGCEISDVNHFFDRVVAPYQPQIIVFYAGDNDIASGETAESVVADFKTFWKSVGRQIPDCTVIYIPIKPSLSRWKLWPQMHRANQTIKQFAKQNYNLRFADIVSPMLNSEGKPKPDLFVKDGLHLNAKGYQNLDEGHSRPAERNGGTHGSRRPRADPSWRDGKRFRNRLGHRFRTERTLES